MCAPKKHHRCETRSAWLHLSRRRQPSRVQRMPGYTVEMLERYYTIGYWILVVHVFGAVCVSWCFLVLVCVRTQCVPSVF